MTLADLVLYAFATHLWPSMLAVGVLRYAVYRLKGI